jgi:hypothetical protein
LTLFSARRSNNERLLWVASVVYSYLFIGQAEQHCSLCMYRTSLCSFTPQYTKTQLALLLLMLMPASSWFAIVQAVVVLYCTRRKQIICIIIIAVGQFGLLLLGVLSLSRREHPRVARKRVCNGAQLV